MADERTEDERQQAKGHATAMHEQVADLDRAMRECVRDWARRHPPHVYPLAPILVIAEYLVKVLQPGSPAMRHKALELVKGRLAGDEQVSDNAFNELMAMGPEHYRDARAAGEGHT